uniref:Uncharacterized protein n=1 Tax=Parascaris univalens TaxID=6257 RepID=A0A915AEY6_PARUN
IYTEKYNTKQLNRGEIMRLSKHKKIKDLPTSPYNQTYLFRHAL